MKVLTQKQAEELRKQAKDIHNIKIDVGAKRKLTDEDLQKAAEIFAKEVYPTFIKLSKE